MDATIVQELSVLLKDVVTLVITTVITIIGFYIRSYLQSNKFVAIAEKYKFDDILNHKKAFKTLVDDIFQNFESHLVSFESYRNSIKNEEKTFDKEVLNLYNLIKIIK